jgi:hypothetical protein
MNRFWQVALVSMLLSGCVLYPTTREYYKPIVAKGQTEVASTSCGYHKAKYDGIAQQYSEHKVTLFPSRDEDNSISITAVLESTLDHNKLVDAEVVTESGALMSGPSLFQLTSKNVDSQGVYRSWFEAKYPPIKTTPQQLTILVTDEDGKQIEFHFEHASQDDIYYASINC